MTVTWVCLLCRRASHANRAPHCPECGGPMRSIGAGMCVPLRRNIHDWHRLERRILRTERRLARPPQINRRNQL